jgi:serine/threonine protein kinase/predicted Zn-dependent peptidase
MDLDEPTRREPIEDPGEGVESRLLLARAQSRLLGWSPDPVRVGRYSVLRRLGEGGMGVVFLGHDEALDRDVALKLLRRDAGSDPSDAGRLLREAQATAKLSHPNVVHVYEVGREGDQVFMAMEFVDGRTLRRWRSEAPRTPREIVEMYLAAGAGLAAAHAEGIVHRDFKPDNVIVGNDGRPRVADFGLARIHDDGHASAEISTRGVSPAAAEVSTSEAKLLHEAVQSTKLAGTPAYMAPEQYEGGLVDPRTDQFAFAVSLFEALFGQRPFAGSSLTELGDADARERTPTPVDPRSFGVSPHLYAVLVRAIALDRNDRFASMTALLDALRNAIAPPRRRTGLIAGLGLTLAAAAVASGVMRGPQSTDPGTDPIPGSEASTQSASASASDPWAEIIAGSELPPVIAEPLAGDPTGVTVHRLRNGLTVYHAHRPLEPMVVVERVGADDTAPEDQGLHAAVLDSLMQGSARFGTTEPEIDAGWTALEHGALRSLASIDDPKLRGDAVAVVELAQAAARPTRVGYEAGVIAQSLGVRKLLMLANEGATLSCEVPQSRVGDWLHVLAETAMAPAFRGFASTVAERIELIRFIARDRVADYEVQQVLVDALGHRYDRVAAARRLAELPLDDAIAFHARWFRPNNTALVLIGDLDAHAAVELADAAFGAWEPAVLPVVTPPSRRLGQPRVEHTVTRGTIGSVEVVWPRPALATARGAAIAPVTFALPGRDGLGALAQGHYDPEAFATYVTPAYIDQKLTGDATLGEDELVLRLFDGLRDLGEGKLGASRTEAMVQGARLEQRRWARSSRNLAMMIRDSFVHREAWGDVAAVLGQTITAEGLAAGARALLHNDVAVLRVRPSGEAWGIDVEPVAVGGHRLEAGEMSAWGRALVGRPAAVAEPRFLVAGSHYDVRPHGAGRVITALDRSPLYRLGWSMPVGPGHDPWICDAVRAKLTTVDLPGTEIHVRCGLDETRIELVGSADGFVETWQALVRWIAEDPPRDVLAQHVASTLALRRELREADGTANEAGHMWALRGGHGLDAAMPDDAALEREGVEQMARALVDARRLPPTWLYAGPDPAVLAQHLPPPIDVVPPPRHGWQFAAPTRPTLVVMDAPGFPTVEVRVAMPQVDPSARGMLIASVYDRAMSRAPDSEGGRLDLQPFTPGAGVPQVHGVTLRVAPDQLREALDDAFGWFATRPDADAIALARTSFEQEFRAARVLPWRVPAAVYSWGPAVTDDPRVEQWLALPGLSNEAVSAYADAVARRNPIVSVVADLDAVDQSVLRSFGEVVVVDVADVLRDVDGSELGALQLAHELLDPD